MLNLKQVSLGLPLPEIRLDKFDWTKYDCAKYRAAKIAWPKNGCLKYGCNKQLYLPSMYYNAHGLENQINGKKYLGH
jgi:hypothetical protein